VLYTTCRKPKCRKSAAKLQNQAVKEVYGMANSRPKSHKKTAVTEFPQPSNGTTTAVEDIPEEFRETPAVTPAPPETPAPAAKIGRPKKGEQPPETNFFRRVASVPTAEWGTRVYLYLYQIEPVCDLKQSGGKAYLMRYQEPVRDEHQIMLEQGSGKYRLVLALNKVSPQNSNELARYDFEIYNPQYPPRIPKEVWINDPRNRRWEALLPKEPPPGAAGTMIDAMKMYKEIRSEVREEIEPDAEPAGNTTNDVLQTLKTAKELFAQPAAPAAPAKDPLEIAVSLFTLMNTQKADNPLIEMYSKQMAAMQEELREMRKAQATQPASKGLLEQILDVVGGDNKADMLKKLIGVNAGSSEGPARRTTGLELARELGGKLFDSPIAEGLGQWLGSLATRNVNGTAAMNPGPTNGVQHSNPPDDLMRFVEHVVNPALKSHYSRMLSGADFAAWMADGYPDRLLQIQQFTHPMIPGKRGASAIVEAYKHMPTMWPLLSARGENEFIQFVNEFCQWQPEADEPLDVEHRTVHDGPEEEEGPERI
jgi:hypothetical protein